MNHDLETLIKPVMEVVQLEGWDISLLQKHIEKYPQLDQSVQEGLRLHYELVIEQSKCYLKLYNKRSQIFWQNCRATNSNFLEEWVHLRRIAKVIHKKLYPKPKRPNGKENKVQQDAS